MPKPSREYDVRPLLERVELLRDVQKAEEQIAAGKAVKHETARKRILKNLEK
jgi:hypothetical protein